MQQRSYVVVFSFRTLSQILWMVFLFARYHRCFEVTPLQIMALRPSSDTFFFPRHATPPMPCSGNHCYCLKFALMNSLLTFVFKYYIGNKQQTLLSAVKFTYPGSLYCSSTSLSFYFLFCHSFCYQNFFLFSHEIIIDYM